MLNPFFKELIAYCNEQSKVLSLNILFIFNVVAMFYRIYDEVYFSTEMYL